MRVNRSERFGGGVMLAAAVLFSILPLLSMASAALQPQGTIPVGIQWPSDPQWHNFIDAWNVASITPLLISSAILVLLVVPLAAFLATLAGYALGGLKVRGATVLLLVLMLGLTLPKEATIIPPRSTAPTRGGTSSTSSCRWPSRRSPRCASCCSSGRGTPSCRRWC
jgi:raffinose/stachyose/melibiose transport system permease protein